MPANHQIKHTPAGRAMTLDELEAAIAHARRSGATGTEVPKARILFGGGVKELTIEVTSRTTSDSEV